MFVHGVENKLQELERERIQAEEEKMQSEKYKQILLKQRHEKPEVQYNIETDSFVLHSDVFYTGSLLKADIQVDQDAVLYTQYVLRSLARIQVVELAIVTPCPHLEYQIKNFGYRHGFDQLTGLIGAKSLMHFYRTGYQRHTVIARIATQNLLHVQLHFSNKVLLW